MKTQTKLTLTLAAAAALMLTGCGGGGGSSDSANNGNNGGDYTAQYVPFDAPPIDEATKARYLNAINAARAVGRTCGEYGYFPPAAPVQWSDGLYRAAAEHNADMASANIYEHDGSGTASDWTAQVLHLGRGSNPGERVENNTKDALTGNGENIAASYAGSDISLERAINEWLNSPGHCANLMDTSNRTIGLAKGYAQSGGTYGAFWTLVISVQ